MPDLLIAAIGFSLSQVLLSLLLLARQPDRGVRERLFGLLMVSILGYLLAPVSAGTSLSLLAATVQTAAPGMFWLFSASVFDDHFRLRGWQVGLVSFTVFMPLLGRLLPLVEWQAVFFTLPQSLEFALLTLTLWVVSRHWRTDLVESRRRLRLWFVGLNGSYLFILILSREILFPGAAWLSVLEYLPPAALLLAINVALLQYREGLLFSTVTVKQEPAPQLEASPSVEAAAGDPAAGDPAAGDPALVARLQSHMEQTHAWREMGLSIGKLADQLAVPEYRLRQAINRGLGHRNFSDFLNGYRIRETARRLADPAEAQLPVLTIAMDAGFRSLSSFNKAFKDTQGVTPTAWRKSHPHGPREDPIALSGTAH